MELPTCPSCKQSVLDDDAVDCPFCGAPMKGGASPPKAPPGKSGSSASAGKPAAPKPAAKPAEPAEDDPFGINPANAANAIPVSAKPAAGKTIEVTCPMCETKGFISPKAAGKQLKCCNPKCMVPLFSAPSLEKKDAAPAPKAPAKKLPWMYIIGGAVTVIIAGISIYVMQNPGGVQEIKGNLTEYVPKSSNDPLTLAPENNGNKTDQTTRTETPKTAEAERSEAIKQALARLTEASQSIPEVRRPMWRRLATTAYFYGGDEAKAREQLTLLRKSTNQSAAEGIPPLTALAWQNIESREEFGKNLAEAVSLAEKLPARSRFATEASLAVAPLLVANGQIDAARELLAKHPNDLPIEQLSATLRLAIEDRSFNFDRTLAGRTIGDWQHPLDIGMTLILAAHGRWDDALAWANQVANPVAKTEALSGWAESLLRDSIAADDAEGLKRAVAVGAGMTPEGKARLLARLAAVRLVQGNKASATELMDEAQKIVTAFPPGKPVVVEGIKPLLDLKLEDPVVLKQRALAAAELACVQARAKEAKSADNLTVALNILSAIGPGWTSIEERKQQLENETARVSAELKRTLALKGGDEERRALSQYKGKLKDVEKGALLRYETELTVLNAAALAGMHETVWNILEVFDRKKASEHQPLIASYVSIVVAKQFAAAGNTAKRDSIIGIVESRVNHADPQAVKLYAEFELSSGEVVAAAKRLNASITPHGLLHESVFRLANHLVSEGKLDEALTFASKIQDSALREESLFFTAAQAGLKGQGLDYWRLVKTKNLGPVETSAAVAGVVVGLKTPAANDK